MGGSPLRRPHLEFSSKYFRLDGKRRIFRSELSVDCRGDPPVVACLPHLNGIRHYELLPHTRP